MGIVLAVDAGAAWSRIGASAPVLPASTCSIATLWPHSEILSPSLAGGWCIFSKISTFVFYSVSNAGYSG